MAKLEYEADVIVVGLGAAGCCAAIEAHDMGVHVIGLEKQPRDRHYSNTRMSGGGFHSPESTGNFEALKAYSKAMFSGQGLPGQLPPSGKAEFSDEIAELWAKLSPHNEAFMRGLDPLYKTVKLSNAAFSDFPGAAESGYAVVKSTYTGAEDEETQYTPTASADKSKKESGEAFHACLMTGIQSRNIDVQYDMRVLSFVMDGDDVIGVESQRGPDTVVHYARRAIIMTCGGFEYNSRMRDAFLDGPGSEGWAFYGSPANTGDGIRMALKIGAGLSKVGSIAGRVICAIPERRNGLRLGLNTSSVGKPNEIVVDNHGQRYASERRITKDPSRYIFYKDALQFDTIALSYPRIPSWMIFDTKLMEAGPLVRLNSSSYNDVDWGRDNQKALQKGWILKGDTLEELANNIRNHPDGRGEMTGENLARTMARWNAACLKNEDPDFERDPKTMGGPIDKPPYFAIPLYPGGPNTKGGLRSNAQRQVLDWEDQPIPRLYTAGEISSIFKFVYQGGGNLGESITFGRLAGRNAAAETRRAARLSIDENSSHRAAAE